MGAGAPLVAGAAGGLLGRTRGWFLLPVLAALGVALSVLVTDALHLRRAGALCRSAGLEVVRVPCIPPECDPVALRTPAERRIAWRDWARETYYLAQHRMLGWL